MKPCRSFFKKFQNGQTSIELATLIIVVMAALIVAQVYFKRSIQGRWKTAVDELSDEMYDPYLTKSDIMHRIASNSIVEIVVLGGNTIRTDQTNSLDTRSGKTFIGGYN